MSRHIRNPDVPSSTSPVAQAMCCGNMVFVGGQMPRDASTGLIPAEPRKQAELSMNYCLRLVRAAGFEPQDIMLVFAYLTNLEHKPMINEVFLENFGTQGPARNLVEVSQIGDGAVVEFSVIACKADAIAQKPGRP